jgi:hypothetical protein
MSGELVDRKELEIGEFTLWYTLLEEEGYLKITIHVGTLLSLFLLGYLLGRNLEARTATEEEGESL